MTAIAGDKAVSSPAAPTAARIAMWVVLFQLAWNWRKLAPLFAEGAMPDTDDYVRLQQVRDWLGGQGWFDLVQHRMDPPLGADIHWSRLVDLPVAGLIRLFGLALPPPVAEAAAALVWPTLLLIATVFVILRICRALGDEANPLLAVLFTVTCVTALTEFMPGRIDHHSVQILLFCLLLLGLVAKEPWGKLLAGAAIAASVSVGLDAILVIGLILGWIGLEWVLGRDGGAGLRRTATGLLLALPLYAANFPPGRWLEVRCDANSLVYLTALTGVAFAFFLLAAATSRLPAGTAARAVTARLVAAAGAAAILLGGLYAQFPQCAAGPYGTIDPELAARWLPSVNEAMGLFERLERFPEMWLSGVAYGALLLLVGAWVVRARAARFPAMIPAFAALALSIAAAALQYRALRIGIFASIPLLVAFVAEMRLVLERRFASNGLLSVAQAAGVAFLLSPVWWVAGVAIFPPVADRAFAAAADGNRVPEWKKRDPGGLCNQRRQYAALDALPPGLVMADINSGPVALAMTRQPVVGGPYHRNASAILDILDFFGTDADTARSIAVRRQVRYVYYCDPGDLPAADVAASGKLAALILKGEEPGWLERIGPAGERFHLFRVR